MFLRKPLATPIDTPLHQYQLNQRRPSPFRHTPKTFKPSSSLQDIHQWQLNYQFKSSLPEPLLCSLELPSKTNV